MENMKISITPSLVMEYIFCPRFFYFMNILNIPQHEETRIKVLEGREIHKYKALTNKDYLRKKLNVVKKEIEQELYADRLMINGKIDEILFFSDGTAAPLDYKFAVFNDKVFETHKVQSTMYAMMIEELYKVRVNKGYIVYTRSNNHIEEIEITENDKNQTLELIKRIFEILEKNYFPNKTNQKGKCDDCCYKNICIK